MEQPKTKANHTLNKTFLYNISANEIQALVVSMANVIL